MWFPFARRTAALRIVRARWRKKLILGRQHHVWVACGFVLADELALQFNQFGVMIAVQRSVGGDDHGRADCWKACCAIGCTGQDRGKCADDWKADHIGQLTGTQRAGLVGLGTKTLGGLWCK